MEANLKVLCLGSQDCEPMPGNDCSHFLVNDRVFIDCGTSPVMNVLNAHASTDKVRTILLTHTHGDHTLGLPSLMARLMSVAPVEQISVYGPKGRVEDTVRTAMNFVFRKDNAPLPRVVGLVGGEKFTVGEGDEAIDVSVLHAEHAEGYAVSYRLWRGGSSVGFTGDTYSLPQHAEFFRGADALVHEASFGRENDPVFPGRKIHGEDGIKKASGHSSPIDAAATAEAAGVRRVMLTHSRFDHADRVKQFTEYSSIPVCFLEYGTVFTV